MSSMQLKGIGVSAGTVVARCIVIEDVRHGDYSGQRIEAHQVDAEVKRILQAVSAAQHQLTAIKNKAEAEQQSAQADVMEAHLMMLGDPMLAEGLHNAVAAECRSAQGAVQHVIAQQAAMLEALDDEYFRERAHDIRDIGQRLLNEVMGYRSPDVSALGTPAILIARDIPPSLMAAVDRRNLAGIIGEIGGKTSHTAILANNMNIPAVLGCEGAVAAAKQLPEEALIAVDGSRGLVHFALNTKQISDFTLEAQRHEQNNRALEAYRHMETVTLDGHHIQLAANVMGPGDLQSVLTVGAEGVGLYRTEFLFMDRSQAPDEEEQFRAYRTIVEGMNGKPVIIRTMDIGGDKEVSYLGLDKEENPFLGYRALRVCLDSPELFQTQLRAILRASAFGQVQIMFPMVCSLEEVRAAKGHLEAAKGQLRERDISFDEAVAVGIMIEIPSAALIADILIKEVDFFSIGSNDLTQYALAVDRMNEKISGLYNSFHPAMLRLIKMVAEAVKPGDRHKFAGMCGEMAGDPRAAMLLVGLGLHELSMSPGKLLRIRKILRGIRLEDARALAAHALTLETSEQVEDCIAAFMPAELADLLN